MRRSPALIALFALSLAVAPAAPASAAWVWPVKGDVITPYRNGTDPYASGQHRGIDIAAAMGTPVVAAADGEVRFAGSAGSSGLTISIRTGDGYDTSYLHLSSLAVRGGARVSAGERIGAVGTTGTRSATAPHLHFGVRDAGTSHAYHDPLAFLPPPPAAPAPQPPAPAPAPAPDPARPAPAPPVPAPARKLAPAAQAPAPMAEAVRRPAALSPLPLNAPVPRPNRSPARPLDHAHPRGQVAAPELNQQPAAGRGASVHRRADARSEARLGRAPSPSTQRGAVRQAGAGAASPHTSEATRQEATRRESHGSDIAWALACGGLLLAAAILGLADDARRAARPGRSVLARLRMALPRG